MPVLFYSTQFIFALHNNLVNPVLNRMFIIIAIGWLYVALMQALGAESVFLGILSFLAWGPLPLGILWYIFARKRPPAPPPDQSG